MTKEYVKKSHIASWPENDVYFSTGISALARKVTNSHSGPDYLFINLNSYTLKLFFSIVLSIEQEWLSVDYYFNPTTHAAGFFLAPEMSRRQRNFRIALLCS